MSESSSECRTDEQHCITCGDEGIPVRVVELRDGLAVCADHELVSHQVAIDLVEPVAIGDELLVHAGVAIAHIEGARR
jgi:hydrogenase maturation factor